MKPPPFKALLPLLLLGLLAAAPPAPEFPLDFRAICPYDARLCVDYDALNSDLDGVAGQKLDSKRVSNFNENLVDVVRRTDGVVYSQAGKLKIEEQSVQASVYGGLWVVREKIKNLSLDSAPDEIKRLYLALMAEEHRADELMADLNGSVVSDAAQQAAAGKLDALNADATRTWEEVKAFSLNADRLGSPIESVKDGKMGLPGKLVAEFVNPLQERVAGLRDRLLKIKRSVGTVSPARTASEAAAHEASKAVGPSLAQKGLTSDVFEHKSAQDLPGAGVAARPPPPPIMAGIDREPGREVDRVTLTVSPKTLLDNRPPPEVARPTTPLPPRTFWQRLTGASPLYGGAEFTEKDKDGKKIEIVEDAFPKETERIAALRDAGKTSTIGDPGGRAQYVFRQTGGTCALASQAQIYAESHGIKPTRAAMRQIEDEFFAKASATKQFNGNSADPKQRWDGGGTNAEHLGNMLDTPLKKHYLAKDEELLAAVSRGKMVMISANTGLLWNDQRHMSGGHIVVITGAEVDQAGALLGYYINDTGTGEAARFVSAKQFMPAWQTHGSVFIEPL
jgi:hypothetical protein